MSTELPQVLVWLGPVIEVCVRQKHRKLHGEFMLGLPHIAPDKGGVSPQVVKHLLPTVQILPAHRHFELMLDVLEINHQNHAVADAILPLLRDMFKDNLWQIRRLIEEKTKTVPVEIQFSSFHAVKTERDGKLVWQLKLAVVDLKGHATVAA